METPKIPGWKTLLADWTDLVRHHPDGFEIQEGQEAIARLANRHGGVVEDTGGGVEVGFVRFTFVTGSDETGNTALEDATATVTDESIALWIGDEPYVDLPAEEIFAGDVTG